MSGRHAGDLLSAMLDGELSPAEATSVRGHLETCLECQRELDYISGARSLVRGLPPVDPPFGLIERLLSPRNRWARAAVGLLAGGAAASVAVIALAAPREAPVTPPVATYADTHVASASTSGDPISELTPAAVPVSFGK